MGNVRAFIKRNEMIDINHIPAYEIRIDTTIKTVKSNTYYMKAIPPKPPRPKTTTTKDSTAIKFKLYGKKSKNN
jgi:hypothetical protein